MGASAAALWATISGTVASASAPVAIQGIGTVAATGTAVAEGAGAGIGAALAQGAAGAAVGAGLSALLAPKIPGVKGPTPMPDQSAIDSARKRSVVQQRQRAGRASTILSQGDGGTLG